MTAAAQATPRWKTVAIYAGLAVWLVAVCGGVVMLWRYKLTAGALPAAPEAWPTESAIRRNLDGATVVMITHPQCPCTRASITELDRLARALGDRARTVVVLVLPEGTTAGFEHGDIEARADSIPRTTTFVDAGGREAERFGAVVSGSTVVYDRAGELLFRGGLTAARGHEGKGPAFDRIVALVAGKETARHDAPAFGCSVKDPEPEVKTP